jgi:hypothetical protein
LLEVLPRAAPAWYWWRVEMYCTDERARWLFTSTWKSAAVSGDRLRVTIDDVHIDEDDFSLGFAGRGICGGSCCAPATTGKGQKASRWQKAEGKGKRQKACSTCHGYDPKAIALARGRCSRCSGFQLHFRQRRHVSFDDS